jgi:hypothetical protein
LFKLSKDYLATSPEQAAQDYISSRQGLLQPMREKQLSDLRSRSFATGRGGLGVQTGTGRAPTSPEMQAYYNALAQQDLQLAAEADLAGRQRTQFGASLAGTGTGLLGTQIQGYAGAYAPLLAQLGLSSQIENLSQQPYQLGLQLGQAQIPGQQIGSQQYFGGQMQGAQTQLSSNIMAQQMNNQFLKDLISAGAGAYGAPGGGGTGATLPSGAGAWNSSMPYTNQTRGYDPWSSPSDYSYQQQSYGGLF